MPARRRLILIALLMLALLVVVVVATPFVSRMGDKGDRITVKTGTTYTAGQYYGVIAPWAVIDRPVMRQWAKLSESMWIDLRAFPANTRFNWAWPPYAPSYGPGVWGYHHLGYGNYDGGAPEKPVTPRRVRDIRILKTAFDWTGDFRFGEATVLSEFYLRRDPGDSESKQIEIGWFFHVSAATRRFVAAGRSLGTYIDPTGRQWRATLQDRFLTFWPSDGRDVATGVLDMRHALGWLTAKGLANPGDWLTGVAIGAEPIKGFGSVDIKRWQVQFQ
ncbi:hypothetical protein [Sphingomonas sp. NBWT7]|uniref:hypothetical protein n=1 Tax=Sphingomonas sp. NBWT7 TaxID=2596913 RepID=UPI0016236963|nr:hypothetical protein [Sphingomonas sp. NBWT7]